ncbi:MAG: hypothetical protein AAGC83_05985, partial [Pseudomonadota bacterium]
MAVTAQSLEIGQPSGGGDLDIAEAAAVLGIPVPTLRKRLQRGTQPGFKSDDGTWRVVVNTEAERPADMDSRPQVGIPMGDASRPAGWNKVAQFDQNAVQQGTPSAMIEMLAGEIRELREEIERNSALLESTQWQIAQINPPGQIQNLQSHTETAIENQLKPVVSALMAVL